ncbi:FKBP-type peptidyl-prolyl cis-trans isomerase [Acinetobacter qingfengensis]|uniref:Peptidyl-prolyl cis-trans isomerase n=1 Tax=Acinetobacter qingfengensis TaxID=1262585 RepID=A0A1E7R577_9GAMM|nr:FKBP-type peptidyl-prolyl cis-trans isomerase [Acinetobacter qingfengensis]KAA8730934.1 FKBP-type peptidyl-prolyl cis-trans isomerase [Acinetobacter qingfengensis]OEY94468.1 peptidylprolyl isomerase [Acinetobacter qingfengensis]
MSKALPIVVAAVLGSVALVPVFYASKNPNLFQTGAKHSSFNVESASPAEKISYVLGYEVASQTPPELNIDAFNAGARSGHAHEAFPFTEQEVNEAYQQFVAAQKTNQPAAINQVKPAIADQNQDAKFLAENAKKAGVKTTASGLQYIVDKEGMGKSPKSTDVVKVNYEGKLVNGQVFDSSFDRGQPIEFRLDQVIPGWTEGLQLMKEGGEYTFFIPSNLAYGPEGKGPIPPNSTLIFKVQLIAVQ